MCCRAAKRRRARGDGRIKISASYQANGALLVARQVGERILAVKLLVVSAREAHFPRQALLWVGTVAPASRVTVRSSVVRLPRLLDLGPQEAVCARKCVRVRFVPKP